MADALLNDLCERYGSSIIQPIVRKMLTGARSDDVPDIHNEALVQLWSALVRTKADLAHRIRDFEHYAGEVARNACLQYWSRSNPRWRTFRGEVRFTLKHHRDFALWSLKLWQIAGLNLWEGEEPGSITPLLNAPECVLDAARSSRHPNGKTDHPGLLRIAFHLSRCPLLFGRLVTVLQDWVELREVEIQSGDQIRGDHAPLFEKVLDNRTSPEEYASHREELRFVWDEIRSLPHDQRLSWLLNPGAGADISAFPSAGVASASDIASALEWTPERLGQTWRNLPFEDARIAEELGCKPQRIINLRAVAKKHLARRLRAWRKEREAQAPPGSATNICFREGGCGGKDR